MKLDILTSNDDEVFLFERIVKHVQKLCECTTDEAVNLVSAYVANFTDPVFCKKIIFPYKR